MSSLGLIISLKKNKSGFRIYLIFLISLLLFSTSRIFPQTLLNIDTTSTKDIKLNKIEYGVDKIVNTYAFKGNADFLSYGDWGSISLKQLYFGKAIGNSVMGNPGLNLLKTSSFWDDELLNLGLDIKTFDGLIVKFNQNLTYYSSDFRQQGRSSISQSRSTGGLKYSFNEFFTAESNIGYEFNNQRDVKGEGIAMNLRSDLLNYNLDEFYINANTNAEYIGLNDGRVKTLLDMKGNLFREFDNNNRMKIDIRYRKFYYPVALSDVDEGSIKNRLEDNITAKLFVDFGLSDNLFGAIGIIADDKDVSHSYNKFFEGYNSTSLEKKRNELNLNFSGEIFYQTNHFEQSLGLIYSTKDEKNIVNRKFQISEQDFKFEFNNEKKLDNLSSTTQLRTKGTYTLSKNDTLRTNLFFSIYRYDTPSEEINDDRDEFSTAINIKYLHRFSDLFYAGFDAEVQMVHYVYIKSVRSADNNWWRGIKLSPRVSLNSNRFKNDALFYVSANYYSYDFEVLTGNIESYSIREIGYKDSIYFKLSKEFNLQSNLRFRYYEQGILFWDNFAETPQTSNYEHFIQFLVHNISYEDLDIGCGIRFFELKQKNLGTNAFSSIGIGHISFAPEATIVFRTKNNISIEFRGWYEFQKTNRTTGYKEIPNLMMLTRIDL